MAERAPDSLRGRTVRWTFSDGPTQGKTYEHTLHEDGTVEWREVGGDAKREGSGGPPPERPQCAVERVTADVRVISYLAPSGYTLTSVLSFEDMSLLAFASNETSWFPARGTFELVK